MPVLAMQVVFEESHPNANALHIYTFQAPGVEDLRVIANLENTYQVGDIAAVATVGSVLKDGTRIKKASLRGVDSFGMALGKVQVEVGTDLTEEYGRVQEDAQPTNEDATVVKWTSIQQLPNLRVNLEKVKEREGDSFVYPVLTFKGKIKLDGSNAAVQLSPDGSVVAQSRTRLLTVEDDNYQFAQWVEAHRDYFAALGKSLGPAIVFGEWCGKGIQRKVAIAGIDRRVLAVFAIQYGDHNTNEATIDIEPARIRSLLPDHPDIFVLPWYKESITLDFGNTETLQEASQTLNEWVEAVETRDPWVSENFGVDGVGEGLVMYPYLEEAKTQPIPRDPCTDFMFKAKGEKHRVVRQKQAVQIDPEVAKHVDDFVAMFVTPARLEQAIGETCERPLTMKELGGFLKWIGHDIQKESVAELEASGLEWKQVSKPAMNAARQWFFQEIKQQLDS
ncbi:MAG: hypothetical protein EP343_20325 [Deltaproteobacteria bacterium]|nr:MAG: hypothetical protein EP343_20325 [Deltaproteobacteria bacterium]